MSQTQPNLKRKGVVIKGPTARKAPAESSSRSPRPPSWLDFDFLQNGPCRRDLGELHSPGFDLNEELRKGRERAEEVYGNAMTRDSKNTKRIEEYISSRYHKVLSVTKKALVTRAHNAGSLRSGRELTVNKDVNARIHPEGLPLPIPDLLSPLPQTSCVNSQPSDRSNAGEGGSSLEGDQSSNGDWGPVSSAGRRTSRLGPSESTESGSLDSTPSPTSGPDICSNQSLTPVALPSTPPALPVPTPLPSDGPVHYPSKTSRLGPSVADISSTSESTESGIPDPLPSPTSTLDPSSSQTLTLVALPSTPPAQTSLPSDGPIHYQSVDTSRVEVNDESAAAGTITAAGSSDVPPTEQKAKDKSGGECVVCYNAPAEAVCIPCGHLACCMECLKEIRCRDCHCPVCRASIQQVVKIYFA